MGDKDTSGFELNFSEKQGGRGNTRGSRKPWYHNYDPDDPADPEVPIIF